MGNMVNTITVQVKSQDVIDSVITQIQILLVKRHETTLENTPYTVRTQQEIIETQAATTAAFRSLLAWVAAVSLLVGGIGIMNIMLVSVTERTREIGIRMSIGAPRRTILRQFLLEALLLSIGGGMLGIATGAAAGNLVAVNFNLPVIFPWGWMAVALLVCSASGISFGRFPAWKAAGLDPVEALRASK